MAESARSMIGITLGGYVIERELGRGAMGVVYQARQVSLDRPVAVKMLHAHLSADDTFIARLQREARAIARLNHPNIVQILGIGTHEGVHYFAMELVDGETVQARLKREGRLKLAAASRILAQACQGVHAAHEAGILHRDLKPENLIVGRDGRIKVMDFGVAGPVDPDGVRLTHGGALVGTPAFMAPEQAAGKPATRESDIYALGVLFYELLTGALPFTHTDLLVLLQLHQWEEPVPPRSHVPELPVGVEEILLKMLAKAPAERYHTCQEVVADLRAVAQGHPERSTARGTRTTGAVGMDLAGAGPAHGRTRSGPADDPLVALVEFAHARVLEAARLERVRLHLRNGGVLSGSAGHFAQDVALLSVPDVGDIALPVDLLAPEPYTYGLDETALRRHADRWADAFYTTWTQEHTVEGLDDWVRTMLADADVALPVHPPAPPPEARAVAAAWAALCEERRHLQAAKGGTTRGGSGTLLLDPGATYPDRLVHRTGKVVHCRIEDQRPSSLWVERADGRRVRIPVSELQCVLRGVPASDAARPPAEAYADRVTLRSGRELRCTILEQTRDALRIRKDDAHETRLYFREIQSATWARAGADAGDTEAETAAAVRAAEARVAEAEAAYQTATRRLLAAVAPAA